MAESVDIKFTADTSSADGSIQALGKTAEATAQRMARATELDAASRNRQVAAINRQAKAIEEQNRIAAAAAGTLPKAAMEAERAMDSAAKATSMFGAANAATSRELMVMFHEGISGNFKRMGGSFVVLAEHSEMAAGALSALAGPIGIAIGAVGALGAAVVAREMEITKLAHAVALTGNAAGMTVGSFDRMAESISKAGSTSLGKAQEALQELASTGTVGAAAIERMGLVAVKVAALSGQSVQEVAREMSRAGTDVAAFAKEHANAWGSVTVAQYQAIQAAQKMGDTQGALVVYLDAMNKRLPATTTYLGALGAMFSSAGAAMQRFFDPGDGQKLDDLDAKINGLFKRIADGKAAIARGEGNPTAMAYEEPALKAQLQRLTAMRNALAASEGAKNSAAMGQSKEEQAQKEAVASADFIKGLAERGKAAETLTQTLQHLAKARDEVVGKGGTVSDDEYAAAVRGANKLHGDRSGNKEISAYDSTLKQLTDEKTKLDALTASYKDNSHAVTERAAVLQARFADPADKLYGLSATKGQGATLMKAAVADDAADEKNKDGKRAEELMKQAQAYAALTAAREVDTKTAFVEQALKAAGFDLSKKETDATALAAKAIVEKAAADEFARKQDASFADAAKKRNEAASLEVDAINRENAALHQTTLQREIAADAAKLQKAAEEEMRTHAGEEVAIQAALAQNIAAVTAARTAQYNDSRSAPTGASNAATKWAEDASNQGALAAKMTTSSLDTISSALTKLAETGQFSFKKLWKSMSDEFLANIIRMQVANAASGAGNLFGSIFSSLSGGANLSGSGVGGDAGAGNYTSAGLAAAFGIAGMRATGGNVNAGGKYITGELGPELFVPSGSGTIIPNDALGGGSGGDIHIGANPTYNIGAGTSRAEVAAAVAQGNKQTLAQVQRLSSTGKLRQ